MKFIFSTTVGRGKGNEVVFSEEVEVPNAPSTLEEAMNGGMKMVKAEYDKWESGLVKGGGIKPVYEK